MTRPDPSAPSPRHRLQTWLEHDALPFWATRGWDEVHGGVHECMTAEGVPDLTARKRVRVQFRQIYVYSHAAALGWHDGTAFALELLDWTIAKARVADGRAAFVHLLEPDGSVANPSIDTYDQAFVLLSLAWLAKASGDAQVVGLIDACLAFLDETLGQPDGSYLEGEPAALPRRQNPHMHLFEAMLALHEAVNYPGAMARAERLHALFMDRFLVSGGRVREFFDAALRPAAGEVGEVVEPGHQSEWTWLLRRFERLSGRAPGPLASDLLTSALGTARPDGFFVDETDMTGRVRRDTARLWVQTERIKAEMSEAMIGVPGAPARADHALQAMFGHSLGRPFAAGWIDQIDAQGRPTVDTVPASTLYHIFGVAVQGLIPSPGA